MACNRSGRYNPLMRNNPGSAPTHGTTVLCVRKDNKVVLVGDGQVTMGDHVMKHTARKTRRLYNDKVLAGFAGSTADAITLFERFEGKLQETSGNLQKAAVELAKDWRKDRALRHLEAMLIVADSKSTFIVSGNGDDWFRRQLCFGRLARDVETFQAVRQRPGYGSDAHRQRNLHLYQCKFHGRRAVTGG